MLNKEEFKKEYIRMMDSGRPDRYKGSANCSGIGCKKCLLNAICDREEGNTFLSFETIEIVEKWSKDHPTMSNADKFKEVFGVEPRDSECEDHLICPRHAGFTNVRCDLQYNCNDCKQSFWYSEYKAPQESEVNE